MPRIVRRRPWLERVTAYLNPLDFLLWLSEEVDSNDWDEFQRRYATPLGLSLNLFFLIARANSGGLGGKGPVDDVFGDETSGLSWWGWFASFVVHLLTLVSLLNAIYTFYRTRYYRLFEKSVEAPPSTPSAHRVHVQSSPMSSSPLRFLSSMIAATAAESRAHPDAARDVWELAVWDPLPLCLRIFCLFSPGHVLVYWLFLPTLPSDPRPSTTVLTTMVLGVLLSTQLMVLQTSYSQQSKDTAVIHREVLHEYDVKFVHPRTTVPVRDVGIQYRVDEKGAHGLVETYTPTAIVNKGFRTNPNPNYAAHTDLYRQRTTVRPSQSRTTPTDPTAAFQTPRATQEMATPLRRAVIKPPQFRGSTGGDGGSLGVFSHAHSPFRKAASTNFAARPLSQEHCGPNKGVSLSAHGSDVPQPKSPVKRDGSPLKRSSVPGGLSASTYEHRVAQSRAGMPDRRESGYF
ncbi:MAG: hypothetical protein M1838_001801 [Thelocarpon superellum]|nr:MAG: hypothetical protein M1838_001801 [Thelocarpon superellum]